MRQIMKMLSRASVSLSVCTRLGFKTQWFKTHAKTKTSKIGFRAETQVQTAHTLAISFLDKFSRQEALLRYKTQQVTTSSLGINIGPHSPIMQMLKNCPKGGVNRHFPAKSHCNHGISAAAQYHMRGVKHDQYRRVLTRILELDRDVLLLYILTTVVWSYRTEVKLVAKSRRLKYN